MRAVSKKERAGIKNSAPSALRFSSEYFLAHASVEKATFKPVASITAKINVVEDKTKRPSSCTILRRASAASGAASMSFVEMIVVASVSLSKNALEPTF